LTEIAPFQRYWRLYRAYDNEPLAVSISYAAIRIFNPIVRHSG
jgi:hypothetical protein